MALPGSRPGAAGAGRCTVHTGLGDAGHPAADRGVAAADIRPAVPVLWGCAVTLPREPDPTAVIPLIATPANELGDLPQVRVNYFEQVPYVQVLDDYGAPVLDLSCTDALNLALLLTAEAGQGLNRQLARALPQAQEVD